MLQLRLLTRWALVLAAGLWTAPASAQDSQQCFTTNLLGGTTQVCADVYENPSSHTKPNASTILALHGFTETADTWGPLKDAIFAHPKLGSRVERIIALDLPGRESSPAPVGLPGGLFQDLIIENYAGVIIQVIDGLAQAGLGVDVVLGHSMGGLEIQSVQEQLLAQGSSLAQHGVSKAVLLAAVPNSAIVDYAPLVVSSDLSPVFTPALGLFFQLDPATAQGLGFLKASSLASFPFLEIVCYDGVVNPDPCTGTVPPNFVGLEPFRVTLQLVGGEAPPPFPAGYVPPRPFARQGAFHPSKGTFLGVIGLTQDVLTPVNFQLPLYQYLVGTPSSARYREVDTDDAVHSMHIVSPETLLDELDQVWQLF